MARRRSDDLPLTKMEQAWAAAYLLHGCATQAAREAGYKGSSDSLAVIGYENKNKPKIKKYIAEYYESKIMPPEEVVARISDHARGTLDDFIDDDEDIDLSKARANNKMHLLKKYKTKKVTRTDKLGGVVESVERSIEIYAADKALDTLAQIHGLKKLPAEETHQDEPTAEEVEAARAAVEAQTAPEAPSKRGAS